MSNPDAQLSGDREILVTGLVVEKAQSQK